MSINLRYITLDVFTTSRFSGNPLAVVFLSNENPITQDQKQIITKEFNYSETIFVHPPETTTTDPKYAIDIFTTDRELSFAGHPVIGAASLFLQSAEYDKRVSSLTTKSGEIPISISKDNSSMVSAVIPHDVHIHSSRLPLAHLLQLFPSLKQHLGTTVHGEGFPIVSIVKGMASVQVGLPNLDSLAAVTTAAGGQALPIDANDAGGYLDSGWDREGLVVIYFYVCDVWDSELQKKVIRSRMIHGGLEDAATGSAASALASFLTLNAPVEEIGRQRNYHIVQGVEIGKRSDIGVDVSLKESKKNIENVTLSGSSVKIAEGHIWLD